VAQGVPEALVKGISRRGVLAGAAAAAATVVAGAFALRHRLREVQDLTLGGPTSTTTMIGSTMQYRDFGSTGMKVSEIGFGAWGIGGNAYGEADRSESLRTLARAEELGCNFVDTAAVYGDSEALLGEFLRGRRDKWIVSTKFSAQPEGMERTIEGQLRRLGTDTIDFYQVHWAPARSEHELYEALYRLKKSGKARAVGVSLKTTNDIDRVLNETDIDGFMVRLSLLDPEPFLSRLRQIREKRPAIIVRSALKEGFLTGKYGSDVTFTDPNDQRSTWSREQIEATVDAVERFRFLEAEAGSMIVAAAAYPLAFPETSTVILGTDKVSYADTNFGVVPGTRLSRANLERIRDLQIEMGLRSRREMFMDRLRSWIS
jgi:aryl-alcohol dehydrogenase-like predicted oxidoreductase